MNCEQVFQHLASADRDSANGQLDEHLSSCSSCRQMAELFEPVVQLLAAEPSDDVDPISAPCERWTRVWEAVSLAEQTATQLAQFSQKQRSRLRYPTLPFAFAAVLLLGIAIGLVGSTASGFALSKRHDSNGAVPLASEDGRTRQCRYDRLFAEHLGAGLDLCANCRPKLDSELAGVITLCMVCHTRPPADEQHAPVLREAALD